MNKKGFTLVELMAVVAIMAIIIGIAVPSYIAITNSTNQKMLENKISEISAKAEDYASANSVDNTTITVDTLIKEGYLEVDNADNDDGSQITNPMGGYLDCYIVHISKLDGEYSIKVDENTDCKVDVDGSYSDRINVYAYTYDNATMMNGDALGSNSNVSWTNKDVILFADLRSLELTSNKVIWTVGTSSSVKKTDSITNVIAGNYDDYANELYVSADLFLDTEYQVSVETTEGTMTKKVNVKIDKEKPLVETSVSSEWTRGSKTMTITGSDGSGSGIKAFYISKDTTTPSANMFDIESTNNQATKDMFAGTYYVYAIDNAGNISDPQKTIVANIDSTGPTCKMIVPAKFTYSGVEYGWSHEDITITYGCSSDSQTGCKTADKTKTYSAYTQETIDWVIEDNIGNSTNCSQTVTINIDKTTPKATAKANPISLGKQDYTFTSNVNATFGQGGGKSVTCSPEVSKKTGSYTVKCTLIGNNGLSSTVSFTARHSYAATYVSRTCTYERECVQTSCGGNCFNWGERNGRSCDGMSTCGSHGCCSYSCVEYGTCGWGVGMKWTETSSYNCSYYSCPLGGSLSGSTCVY